MTADQDASQTTYLAPRTLSPPLGERELLVRKRREMEDAHREQDVLKEEHINKRIRMVST